MTDLDMLESYPQIRERRVHLIRAHLDRTPAITTASTFLLRRFIVTVGGPHRRGSRADVTA